MKELFLPVILIFAMSLSSAQVGINTTNPTKDLDINGELRIRNLPTQTENTLLAADSDGNIGKANVYLISDINSTIATQNVDVPLSPNTITQIRDSIDLGLSTTITIPANKEALVVITYSVPIGLSTFTSPRGYYGIRFLKDGTEASAGSRKFSIYMKEDTANMVAVSNTYTEVFQSLPTERIITYTLHGYIEQFPSEIPNTYRFNMWTSESSGHNFNWGRAVITKQVYIK